MRALKHWKPHYVVSRAREMIDHHLNPDHPWLTREAVHLLAQLLRADDIVLEFGSGRSTLWFAHRVRQVTSVEHEASWHARGLETLARRGVKNVDLLLRPMDVSESDGANAAYVRVLHSFCDASLEVCIVDGIYRGQCALGAIARIKPGGLIVVDNAGWFLPSRSRTPGARRPADGPMDQAWSEFAELTRCWRQIWTTSGVTDTLLLFKP
jgi:predicted O-methyltransferase YrrM